MKALYDYLREQEIGHVFTIYDVCSDAASDKSLYYQITSAVARLTKPNKHNPIPPLRRVGHGKYCYNARLPIDQRVYKKRSVDKAKQAAKADFKKEKEPEPNKPGVSDVITELRNSKGILDLMCNNKITFQVRFKCSNVERNFQDEIIKFSIESIDVQVSHIDK